ncbi:MAG: PQQ-binding-like beta-propeller repeat protein [Ktedonobacterales bacterium]
MLKLTRQRQWALRLLTLGLVILTLLLAACSNPFHQIKDPHKHPTPANNDWLMFGNSPARSGVALNDPRLTPATVGRMTKLWQVQLPAVADSTPILLHALRFPNDATYDALYVTTRDGHILALNASNGSTLWQHQPSNHKITNSSAAADANRQYVYAYGLDGYLHKYASTTGVEVKAGGWPVRITRMIDTEKEGSAINIANGRIYVTTGGYIGDAPPYQGHVVTIDEATGAATIFNSLCSNKSGLLGNGDCSSSDSGIWSRGGAVIDPVTGNIFVATGNGPYNGATDWGDSVLELSPDGAQLLDTYTPSTQQALNLTDTDLGSNAPALLPKIANSVTPYLLVEGGKDGMLRLLNRQNLSGRGGPGHTDGEVQLINAAGCGLYSQPAVWTDPQTQIVWVYTAGACGLAAYQVKTDSSSKTTLQLAWKIGDSTTSPVVTNGMLFVAQDGSVKALDAHTGKRLWSSTQSSAGGSIGDIHWESPIVVGNTLYISDEDGTLSAYGV